MIHWGIVHSSFWCLKANFLYRNHKWAFYFRENCSPFPPSLMLPDTAAQATFHFKMTSWMLFSPRFLADKWMSHSNYDVDTIVWNQAASNQVIIFLKSVCVHRESARRSCLMLKTNRGFRAAMSQQQHRRPVTDSVTVCSPLLSWLTTSPSHSSGFRQTMAVGSEKGEGVLTWLGGMRVSGEKHL